LVFVAFVAALQIGIVIVEAVALHVIHDSLGGNLKKHSHNIAAFLHQRK